MRCLKGTPTLKGQQMKTKFNPRVCLIAVVCSAAAFLAPIAGAQSQSHGGHGSAPMSGGQKGGQTAGTAMSGASMEMMNMMKDNNQKMTSMSMTGKTDVDFAMMMRMHHMGAIEMAQIELRDGKDPKIRQMAKKIIGDQKKEIAQFESFLAKQGHPVDKMK
jgi:uncharacterized protein (DUF305 family)